MYRFIKSTAIALPIALCGLFASDGLIAQNHLNAQDHTILTPPVVEGDRYGLSQYPVQAPVQYPVQPPYESDDYAEPAYEPYGNSELPYGEVHSGGVPQPTLEPGYESAYEPAYESAYESAHEPAYESVHPSQPTYSSQPLPYTPPAALPPTQFAPAPAQPISDAMMHSPYAWTDASCGAEQSIGCGAEWMAAPPCACGPVCGCEAPPLFDGSCALKVGQTLRGIVGETSPREPCANQTFRPGLISWMNDFCVRNGFAVDSFLTSGHGYTSIDFGIAMTGDRANLFGTTANTIAGSPTFDVQEGSFGRYALGMGSGNKRLELELGFHRNTIDETKPGAGPRIGDEVSIDAYRRSTTLMFNGFYDLHNSTLLTPYLKCGAGISHNVARGSMFSDIGSPASIAALGLAGPGQFETEFTRSGTTKFAWSVGAGLAIDLTKKIKLDFEYQFLNAGEAFTGRDAGGNALNLDDGALHELAFGLRFYR